MNFYPRSSCIVHSLKCAFRFTVLHRRLPRRAGRKSEAVFYSSDYKNNEASSRLATLGSFGRALSVALHKSHKAGTWLCVTTRRVSKWESRVVFVDYFSLFETTKLRRFELPSRSRTELVTADVPCSRSRAARVSF